jgi:hypothetical protein
MCVYKINSNYQYSHGKKARESADRKLFWWLRRYFSAFKVSAQKGLF